MSGLEQDVAGQGSPVRSAVRWFFRIREEKSPPLTPEELRDWERFTTDPGNRRALGRVKSLWQVVRTFDGLKMPSEAEMEADDYDPAWSIGEWAAHHPAMHRSATREVPRRSKRLLLFAAGAAVMTIGLALYGEWLTSKYSEQARMFATPIAQQRTVNLPDGSVLTLGARTEVHARMSAAERVIVLDRGEAWFKVAHDIQRPFRVVAGHGVVTAVGTEFNVRREFDAELDCVTVIVGSGAVKVEPRGTAESTGETRSSGPAPVDWRTVKLEKGEEMTYDDRGQRGVIKLADIEAATAWKEGRLEYIHEPLKVVVAGVNRYSQKPIVLADEAVGKIDFSGTVFEGQIGDWLRALQAAFPISVRESQDRIVIQSRH
jgi:transmembrane sensor